MTATTGSSSAQAPTIQDRINNDFDAHICDEVKTDAMHAVRTACHRAASEIIRLCPPAREQSSALTKLEEAMFHANAGIARAKSYTPKMPER